MYSNLFSAQSVQDLMTVLPSLPFAIWESGGEQSPRGGW